MSDPSPMTLKTPRVDPLIAIEQAFASAQVDPRLGVVVAFSGGPDSLALAACLARWRENGTPGACGTVTLAHANHRWPGLEDHDDQVAERCASLAESIGLPLVNTTVPPTPSGDGQTNIEARSREARYTFLADVAQQTGAACVVTGHTADDQAETVLARMIRGAGLVGLRGIARVWDRPPLIFRPALDLTRAELHAALPPGLTPVDDAANHDVSFTRVRIRRELLPMLQTFNPQIATALRRLADAAAALPDDVPLAINVSDGDPSATTGDLADGLAIARAELIAQGRAQAKPWLDAQLKRCGEAALGAGAFERIWDFAHSKGSGRRIEVRTGLVVVHAGDVLMFAR
jgi:tRNA(Ile)-lysidine synthase